MSQLKLAMPSLVGLAPGPGSGVSVSPGVTTVFGIALQVVVAGITTLTGDLRLTDESRTYQQDRDERSVVIDLADGSKRKFIKAVKNKFVLNWEMAAGSAANTVDGKWSHDEIQNLLLNYSQPYYFFTDFNPQNSLNNVPNIYTVYVDSFTSQIVLRRNRTNYYQMSLELIEA
jgi:hypothetical protein